MLRVEGAREGRMGHGEAIGGDGEGDGNGVRCPDASIVGFEALRLVYLNSASRTASE